MQPHLIIRKIVRWLADEQGASAVEYALLAAFIALVIVIAMTEAGIEVESLYESVANCVTSAAANSSCN